MLRHIDARMITNPRFQRYALDLAEELGIPVQEACAPAALPTARPSICPTRARPSSSSASLCVTSIPTTASPPTATWRTPPGWPRRHFAERMDAAQINQLESQAAPWEMGRTFIDPRKTVPYTLYTSAKIHCPSWLFAVDLSPFPHIQP